MSPKRTVRKTDKIHRKVYIYLFIIKRTCYRFGSVGCSFYVLCGDGYRNKLAVVIKSTWLLIVQVTHFDSLRGVRCGSTNRTRPTIPHTSPRVAHVPPSGRHDADDPLYVYGGCFFAVLKSQRMREASTSLCILSSRVFHNPYKITMQRRQTE